MKSLKSSRIKWPNNSNMCQIDFKVTPWYVIVCFRYVWIDTTFEHWGWWTFRTRSFRTLIMWPRVRKWLFCPKKILMRVRNHFWSGDHNWFILIFAMAIKNFLIWNHLWIKLVKQLTSLIEEQTWTYFLTSCLFMTIYRSFSFRTLVRFQDYVSKIQLMLFVTIFWTTFITNILFFLNFLLSFVIPNSCKLNSEHLIYFLMSGDRNEHLLLESVMKSWCKMSYYQHWYEHIKKKSNRIFWFY
jgi:hypothetical protein